VKLQLRHLPAKRGVVDTYYGKHLYRIDVNVEPFRIKYKRSVLAQWTCFIRES
jgi:hypothetical protein